MTLKGSPGKPIELSVKGIGYDYNPASATNTTTTIDTITLPSSREIAMFQHGVWAMNAQTGGALGGSDAFYVQDWEITFERAMDRLVTTQAGDKTDEPIPSGFAKVSGSWTFPVLQSGTGGNSTFLAEQLALTAEEGDPHPHRRDAHRRRDAEDGRQVLVPVPAAGRGQADHRRRRRHRVPAAVAGRPRHGDPHRVHRHATPTAMTVDWFSHARDGRAGVSAPLPTWGRLRREAAGAPPFHR
jgi:hypothetical protein